MKLPRPPKAFEAFVKAHPQIGEAWNLVREAGRAGPLDERSAHLVKLAVAIGALREGAVHSAARKARAAGVSEEEMGQVVALAVSTVGFPAAVAAFTWVEDARSRRPR